MDICEKETCVQSHISAHHTVYVKVSLCCVEIFSPVICVFECCLCELALDIIVFVSVCEVLWSIYHMYFKCCV